jgi:hypothetical protein
MMTVQAQEQKQGDPFDFIRGQAACDKGESCPVGATKWFERGYDAQYQLEQIKEAQNEAAN